MPLPVRRSTDAELAQPTTPARQVGFSRLYHRARNALADFLSRVSGREAGRIPKRDLEVASLGMIAVLAACIIYAILLPSPTAVTHGSLHLLGISEKVAAGSILLKALLAVLHDAVMPLAVLAVLCLGINAYLSVRPTQPILWHRVCFGEIVLAGLYVGLGAVVVAFIVLWVIIDAALGFLTIIGALVIAAILLSAAFGVLKVLGE